MTAQKLRNVQTAQHWERIHASKKASETSWYQRHANLSLQLIRQSGIGKHEGIIDVGGGTSTLVDDLLQDGYTDLTVLDVSAAALEISRRRLGEAASRVKWIEADITQVQLPEQAFGLWHDRAVFHFLTAQPDRSAYVAAMVHAVRSGGRIIMATFAESGPQQCSGLPVVRYRPDTLQREFGNGFVLIGHYSEDHRTPAGAIQPFLYCRFEKRAH